MKREGDLMKVNIEKNLYLEADSNQFILKEYSGKKDTQGREVYNIIGYYVHIDQVVKTLATRKLKKTTAKNLKELAEQISEMETYLVNICSNIDINYKNLIVEKEEK